MRALPVSVLAFIVVGVAAPTAQRKVTPAPQFVSQPVVRDTTYEIKMVGDEGGYRYDPANITIHQGDTVKFVMVSGGPHNVNFDITKMSAEAKAALSANIVDPVGELSTQYVMEPNQAIVISFAAVPIGKYEFSCSPHLAMDQRGSITVIER